MVVRSKLVGIAIFVLIFGGIFSGVWLGWWQTESDKTPVRYKDGDAAGEYNPSDIRGSYSFGEISELFEIPLEMLARAFRIPSDVDTSEFKNKDLETLYANLDGDIEIGTSSMRLFVAYYKGLPYSPSEDTYLLKPGVNILKANAELTQAQIDYLDAHMIDIEPHAEGESEPQGKQSTDEVDHDESANKVRGKTTFGELLDMGLSEERIVEIIGEAIPNHLMLIRDYCTENELEFSTIKEQLQAELDNLNEG